jgi:hypothetical protein
MVLEVREGITERLNDNNWFKDKVWPNIEKAWYVVGEDGFHYQLATVKNPRSARVTILLLKVAHTGYIKSTMSLTPELADAIAQKLRELAESARQ